MNAVAATCREGFNTAVKALGGGGGGDGRRGAYKSPAGRRGWHSAAAAGSHSHRSLTLSHPHTGSMKFAILSVAALAMVTWAAAEAPQQELLLLVPEPDHRLVKRGVDYGGHGGGDYGGDYGGGDDDHGDDDGGHTKTVYIKVPHPVFVQVPVPHPIPVPHAVPLNIKIAEKIEVPVVKTVHVPVEKHVPIHVEKLVPYPVEKHVPIPVEKPVPVPVSKPYPVKVPVVKYIHHYTKTSGGGGHGKW
ncbi:Uncharacterized protein GBIM_00252 [Gryllus bimaculatus]|nr:Uncharacterized protein GBIM_00252 [Gryllus bimaculatus]